MKYVNLYIGLFFVVLLASCKHNHEGGDHSGHNHGEKSHKTEDAHDHGSHDGHDHGEEHHEEGTIQLSKDQMNTIGLEFGSFSKIKINDYINATGTLGLPPNAYSSVSAKKEGFIKTSKQFIEGMYVKKGAIMANLENPEFITKQQEYLVIKAELVFLRQDLARQQTLLNQNAGIEKNVQLLQSQVAVKEAQLKGITKYLAYLGIPVSSLTTENIRQQIAISVPMSGYLTSINMHDGMYVEPKMELMEIVDEGHLHLELDVFEKDIAQVKKDQLITYTVPALGNAQYQGEVHIIGKEFNKENKTVRIHGHLEKERPNFIKDLFITAKIWLNDQTVDALPESAVIKDGSSSFVYIGIDNKGAKEVEFEKVMVIPGTIDNGFISVKLLDEIPEGMKIVTKGAYYVYAQSKAGELAHEH